MNKQEKLTNGDKIVIVIIYISIILVIFYIGFAIGNNIVQKEIKNEKYKYYDKFCQYLKCNSQAYDECTEKFMKKEYESWLNNTGYGDIIIDIDGNLTSIYTDEGY